jgi:hypothetical protein
MICAECIPAVDSICLQLVESMSSADVVGWSVLVGAGWLTGFLSGLLGIGGGLVIVPALIFGLPLIGVGGEELAKVAIATSLVLIIPTSGDLIRIPWGDYDGERISVTNRKGGRKIRFSARCTRMLRETLDAAKLALGRIPHKDEPILTTVTGHPWVESHFSTKFSAAKNRAGLAHLHFHDLRGTAITVLAENGCTNSEIASITGHSLKHIEKIIDTYMARTRQLNDEAVAKLERSWIASVGAIE